MKLEMAQMLKLSDRDFKITGANMPKDLEEKVDKNHEQIENFSREMETIKKESNRNPTTHTPRLAHRPPPVSYKIRPF